MARRNSSKPPPSSTSSTASTSAPDLSILGDQLSLHPTGYTGTTDALLSSTQAQTSPDQNLIAGISRFRNAPLDFLRELSSHVSGSGWRSYDNVVGQPVFYSGFSEQMKARVVGNAMMRQRIRELAATRVEVEDKEEGRFGPAEAGREEERDQARERRRKEVEAQLEEVVEGMTDAMICKMESKRFIRGAYYFCTQILTRAYHQGGWTVFSRRMEKTMATGRWLWSWGLVSIIFQKHNSPLPFSISFRRWHFKANSVAGIHVSSEEVLRLRAVAEKAEKDKHSIIFLPCHRSHVDYVSLQLICYRLGLALPTVVAGDNLNFPLVGSFLQHAGTFWQLRPTIFTAVEEPPTFLLLLTPLTGAFWIRRSFGDDKLYNALVQSYMDTLLTHGYNFECFVGKSFKIQRCPARVRKIWKNSTTSRHEFPGRSTDRSSNRGRPLTNRKAFTSQIRHSQLPSRQCSFRPCRRRNNMSCQHSVRQSN